MPNHGKAVFHGPRSAVACGLASIRFERSRLLGDLVRSSEQSSIFHHTLEQYLTGRERGHDWIRVNEMSGHRISVDHQRHIIYKKGASINYCIVTVGVSAEGLHGHKLSIHGCENFVWKESARCRLPACYNYRIGRLHIRRTQQRTTPLN